MLVGKHALAALAVALAANAANAAHAADSDLSVNSRLLLAARHSEAAGVARAL